MLDDQSSVCNNLDTFAEAFEEDFRGKISPARPQLREDVQRNIFTENRPLKPAQKIADLPPLVHITESIDTFSTIPDLFQQLNTFEFSKHLCCIDSRFERFLLQGAAREILSSASHPRGEKSRWRTVFCLRHLLAMAPNVAVMLSKEFKKAHYKNLVACGSPWTCPLCACKISEHRSGEVQIAGDKHIAMGGVLYMFTLTFRHSRQDCLRELLGSQKSKSGLAAALKKFRDSRSYRNVLREYGFSGFIRSLEVTFAEENGWHPHIHALHFGDRELTFVELEDLKAKLFAAWLKACGDAGLPLPNREYGLDIVRAYSPAEYLQKWGREQRWGAGAELTKSHIKKSRNRKGYTPFDLLRLYLAGGPSALYYARLFVEYATAFFGSRQCYWSPGLKARFGIGELSDEEIAAKQDDRATLVTSIEKDVWKALLRHPLNLRPVILKLAEVGGKEAVDIFLSTCLGSFEK